MIKIIGEWNFIKNYASNLKNEKVLFKKYDKYVFFKTNAIIN